MTSSDSIMCVDCGKEITDDETVLTKRSNVVGEGQQAKEYYHLDCH